MNTKVNNPRDRARALLKAATPGPWSANLTVVHRDYGLVSGVAWPIAQVMFDDDARPCLSEDGPSEHSEADAALIAAAPELLTALCDELDAADERLASALGLGDLEREALEAMRTKLDRAEAKVARLREALRKTSDLIAANRLVLGEYMDPRYVSAIEDAARAALAESEETT